MTGNEEFIRAVYRTAEGDVQDLEGWRNSFTEDAVFNVVGTEESYTGEALGRTPAYIASILPDVHRELLRVNDMGNVIAVEVLVQGTFLGPFQTPAGPIAPTGARINIPTADFFYLRDGKIETYNSYVLRSNWFAQLGVHLDFATAVAKSAAVG
jgi:ketosteroid isomerase-like protein